MAKIEVLAILFGILLLSHSFASAAGRTIEQKLQSARDYEYLHCLPSDAKDADSVVHYVFDIKNEKMNRLYVTSGLKTLKAEQLVGLAEIESKLKLENYEGYDISVSSEKNSLAFALYVADDGGQFLIGKATHKNQDIAVECRDVVVD